MARESPARDRVWDCATGTGQAAEGLGKHFKLVIGTDASWAQLAHAPRRKGLAYVRSTAESSGLRAASVDAIVVAQAVHWFDIPAFFAEARRVARPGGLVAVWTYGNPSIDPGVDAVIAPFYRDVVGPYWPPERRMIERLYQDIELPFEPVPVPDMPLRMLMTLEALAGYIGTWSAVQRYREVTNTDPMPEFVDALASAWGDPTTLRSTSWPLAVKAGRV